MYVIQRFRWYMTYSLHAGMQSVLSLMQDLPYLVLYKSGMQAFCLRLSIAGSGHTLGPQQSFMEPPSQNLAYAAPLRVEALDCL